MFRKKKNETHKKKYSHFIKRFICDVFLIKYSSDVSWENVLMINYYIFDKLVHLFWHFFFIQSIKKKNLKKKINSLDSDIEPDLCPRVQASTWVQNKSLDYRHPSYFHPNTLINCKKSILSQKFII